MKRKRVHSQFPPSDIRHWEGRVEKLGSARFKETGVYSIRLGDRYRRTSFPLGISNRRAAARRAKEIYDFLQAAGWEMTLERFKPVKKRVKCCTVGEYIAEARRHSEAKATTFTAYARHLRKIVA